MGIKIQHYGYPNQLFQIKVQSRMPGQGRRREDWPTAIEEEQRHALNIGKAKIKAINKESQPAN